MRGATIGKWRQRFNQTGIDGILDELRLQAPRSIIDEHVERVVTMTLENTPPDATHWSTRSSRGRQG